MQGLTVCNLNKICLKQTGNKLKLYHTFLSLPRSRFLDVTQCSPKRVAWHPKNGCEGDYTFLCVVMKWYREVFLIPEKEIWCHFYMIQKRRLTSCIIKCREVTKNKTHFTRIFWQFYTSCCCESSFPKIVSHPESPGSSVVLQRYTYLLLLNWVFSWYPDILRAKLLNKHNFFAFFRQGKVRARQVWNAKPSPITHVSCFFFFLWQTYLKQCNDLSCNLSRIVN